MYHRVIFEDMKKFFYECDNYEDGFYAAKGHYKVGDVIEFRYGNVNCIFKVISILPVQEYLELDDLTLRKLTYEELEN